MPNVTAITLGVADLKKSLDFYESLGFKAGHISDEVIFFQMNGTVLALYGRDALSDDAFLQRNRAEPGGIALAINLPTAKAVNTFMLRAKDAGAKVLTRPKKTSWGGYSGYFADLDGHPWELAWNPFWKLDSQGNVTLPSYTLGTVARPSAGLVHKKRTKADSEKRGAKPPKHKPKVPAS